MTFRTTSTCPTPARSRDELLSVINRGATALIADMTATVSCDHAGADAMVRAYQRAAVSGTQLRLVVTTQIVRRVLSLNGLDRLVSIYPSLEAATAARDARRGGSRWRRGGPRQSRRPDAAPPGARAARSSGASPRNGPRTTAITQAVLRKLIDALADGVALTDDDGTLALVNRRLEDMFGYEHGELVGHPVESLIPADLRAAHRSHRAAYAQAPKARPMGAGARLVGLRKDGATFPVEISLSPVPTATGRFTLAVIRDVTETRRREDLADLARAAVAAAGAPRPGTARHDHYQPLPCRPQPAGRHRLAASHGPTASLTPCSAWTTPSTRSVTTYSAPATRKLIPHPKRCRVTSRQGRTGHCEKTTSAKYMSGSRSGSEA